MNTNLMPSGLGSESPFSPPPSRSGRPESENQPQSTAGQPVGTVGWDTSNDTDNLLDPRPTGPSSNQLNSNNNSAGCDKMVEKWRLIRIADRNQSKRKIYPTDDNITAAFGKNYSKFYEAFRQGISAPQAHETTSEITPAKRSAATPKQASKRRKHNDRASLPHPDQYQARTFSAPQSAATPQPPTRAKPIEAAPSLNEARNALAPPTPRSYSEAKEQRSGRKGVGLYAGNWEYVTDEEKVPEYLRVAEKTADFEGRTTRRAYARLTTGEVGKDDSSRSDGLPSENELRKSGRARNEVNYSTPSAPRDNAREIATPEPIENDTSLIQDTKQISSSTSASSGSDRSTLMPDQPSRSTSTSTAIITDLTERPNRSWNSIVYEVLATSDTPLTYPQLTQAIKDRYPFFRAQSQVKVLKSGPKNPLYFHEAFCKGELVNGKQTWGLRPGRFMDKKTHEVLTPQPRHTISSTRAPKPVDEEVDGSLVESTPKVSQSFNPRSGNPRFGREILNSPEVADSQDIHSTATSSQEAGGRTTAEQMTQLEDSTGAQELADAVESTSLIAIVGASPPEPTPEPRFEWATTTFTPLNTTSSRRSSAVVGSKDQNTQTFPRAIDHDASAIAAQSSSALQAAQLSTVSIPSSTGESEHDGGSTTIQVASTPNPLVHAVSPTHVPKSPENDAATSQTDSTSPPASANHLACTPLDGFLLDRKTGPKEHPYVQL